jgi:hypothetical protein
MRDSGLGNPPEQHSFERWQHKITRETYAVRLTARRVTGVIGPLTPPSVIDFHSLPHQAYESDPDRIAWIQERVGEFLLLPP